MTTVRLCYFLICFLLAYLTRIHFPVHLYLNLSAMTDYHFKLLGNSLTALMGILGGYNYTTDYILLE